MGKDNRVTLTVKLHPVKDADLIQWLENLPMGDHTSIDTGRNFALKHLLRSALGLPIPTPTADAIQTLYTQTSAAFETVSAELDSQRQRAADLQAELERIAAVTANLPTIVKKLAPAAPTAPAVDTAEIEAIKQQIAALMTWANEVHGMIHNGTVQQSADVQPVATEPAPAVEDGLTEEELGQRKRRLKRAQW